MAILAPSALCKCNRALGQYGKNRFENGIKRLCSAISRDGDFERLILFLSPSTFCDSEAMVISGASGQKNGQSDHKCKSGQFKLWKLSATNIGISSTTHFTCWCRLCSASCSGRRIGGRLGSLWWARWQLIWIICWRILFLIPTVAVSGFILSTRLGRGLSTGDC